MNKWLFNPFKYIAGGRALIIGLAVMLLTAVVGYYSCTNFDGVLDAHSGSASLGIGVAEQLNAWGCAVILFYISGLIFSKSAIRFVDVAGTMALARWPMVLLALSGFMLKGVAIASLKDISALVIIAGVLSILISVWFVALMYNAYVLSCNVKGTKAALSFIGALLVAELVSKLIWYQLFKAYHLL